MTQQTPVVRLHLFFATENDAALIVRQGPTEQFRMIRWNRDTDTFEDGQWVKKKVYIDRCDLSPDGRHFIYFMLDGRWGSPGEGCYTAISRPPYWTAISLFPEGSTWGGGGVFLDNRHYYATGGEDIIGNDAGLARVKLGEPAKGCTTGIRLSNGQRAPLDRDTTRRLLGDESAHSLRDIYQRMPVPRPGYLDQYDTMGGKLYRRRGLDLELIRDFTDMEFEAIRAPYDDRPSEPPWHPLDNDKS